MATSDELSALKVGGQVQFRVRGNDQMFTGTIEKGPQRVFYKAVMPLSADARAIRLNLQLSERTFDHTLLLDIERLTYEGTKPLSVEEARKELSREQARAE